MAVLGCVARARCLMARVRQAGSLGWGAQWGGPAALPERRTPLGCQREPQLLPSPMGLRTLSQATLLYYRHRFPMLTAENQETNANVEA